MRTLILGSLFVLLAACSSSGTSTSSGSSGASSGDPTSSSSSSTSSGSTSTTTQKYSCSLNGDCYKCPSSQAVSDCFSKGPSTAGCTSTDPTFCQ